MTNCSSDFDKTKGGITVQIPDRLLHQNVLETGQRELFSKEREHRVAVVDLPTKSISMTIGHLAPTRKTRRHRHTYETVLYIIKGSGRTIVEQKTVSWVAGDAVYVPVWAWHEHINDDSQNEAIYLACENAPLLQNLGGIALREEDINDKTNR